MSAQQAWLHFSAGGPPLPHRLDTEPEAWQRGLSRLHARWYDGTAPPGVAAVFVLQWLLQLPAHTAAHAAAAGPWRAADLADLTFTVGSTLVPTAVRLARIVPDPRDVDSRLDEAERDYRAVAAPLADRYPALVPLGPRTRHALVDDMWAAARQEAETVLGRARAGVLERASCCLIYALPGCVECAGCPRNRSESGPGRKAR
ncbi:(2Fe-2S)-binding protein [uncultured Phycicoccus sp.]|uniref:(2Fe-2S)-binding protein n=1 Tax=uncultured Phycicoccus sp. TaxID=661422 RepID=UPI002623C468|nr:(2Fe-2S)-binding protein [uncultured Phycicoccus sp.]